MKRRARPRTDRRIAERGARQLVRDKQKLASLLPGGSAERPIDIDSTSVIPGRVRSTPCPLCDGELRLEHETAASRSGKLLHTAHAVCQSCGIERELWFHVSSALPS